MLEERGREGRREGRREERIDGGKVLTVREKATTRQYKLRVEVISHLGQNIDSPSMIYCRFFMC